MKSIEHAKRITIKIGSSLIVDPKTGKLHETWLQSLCDDVAQLKNQGKEIVIVSSGATALGKRHIHTENDLKLEEKQAAAACGQVDLLRHYQRALKKHDMQAAQILLTLFDSENRRNYLNCKNTIETLLSNNIIPVVNENDSVATQEIRFGDNDRLAATVAQMIGADLLIILSDIDGLYTANPKLDKRAKHIDEVTSITQDILNMGQNALSGGLGSGGMITKIEAAQIAMQSGCDMMITLGHIQHPIEALIKGAKHTHFISSETPLSARKKWISSNLNTKGSVVIDPGAIQALNKGNSLLPAGVVDVQGEFERGDTITIKNCKNEDIGKGLSAYNSDDSKLIKGQQSSAIEHIVGFAGRIEMIHRDDMVLFEIKE